MTIKTDLEAELAAIKARIPVIETELAKGESWLEAEWTSLEAWVKQKYTQLLPSKAAAPAPASPSPEASPPA